jgi:glycosyltransferase involved in cell wall biosynthesis
MKRLAIISTHPIQYNAPLFAKLAQEPELQIKVFYTLSQGAEEVKDLEFGKTIKWDIPLLEGYPYQFIQNVSAKPGTKHFFGVDNPGLIPAIEEWLPNVLLIYGWSFKSHLAAIRYFKGKIPVFFRGDSTLLNEQKGWKKLARRLFLRFVYRYVDTALYVGTHNKNYFLAHGLRENQLVHVPHVVDNQRFSVISIPQQKKLFQMKRQLRIEKANKVFLFVGKFIDVKNTFLLLEAFHKAKFDQNVHLVFVGDGQHESALKTAAKSFPNVHFLPFQNQATMPLIYRLGHILVMPSRNETWGLAVNEAMAAGLGAVVSNRVGCGPDMIVEGKNGYVFETENINSLVKVLEQAILLDSNRILESNKEVLDRHSMQEASKKIAEIINKADG